MPVSMAKTTPNSHGKSSGGKVGKAPFKKVFSSSHLQTNVVNGQDAHRGHPGRASNDFGSALGHPTLTSQLSSSLPGFLDNVNNGTTVPRRATASGGPPELVPPVPGAGSRRSSQKSITPLFSSNHAVIPESSTLKGTSILGSATRAIPFSSIEPSLIVSLSTYLNALKNFDSEKLIKEIHLMLTYYEDVVRKDKLEQLVGACTILMETVDANCTKLKGAYRQLQQVQLRLQLLLQSFTMDDDESETLTKLKSSTVIEANNELYRKMAQLLQWSDQVSTLHQLIENGDARIGTSSVSNTSNQGSPSPERADTDGASLSSTPTEATPRPSPPQSREVAKAANIKKAHEVSRDLLESFENLVKAYKGMENELRACYDEYSISNKQVVDLILSESPESSQRNASLASVRRRSITPPPDYPHSSSGSSGSNRMANGSTSTIASSASSSSSGSSHFRHRFFPNLTNHAQKMAHKMLSGKSSKQPKDGNHSPVGTLKADGSPADKHSAWSSIWPLLGSNLRRSESASDITSTPRPSAYLDIPDGRGGKPGARNRSPSPFRKHSINEQLVTGGSSSNDSSDCLTMPSSPIRTLLARSRKSSTSQAVANRHSDGSSSPATSRQSPQPPPSLPLGQAPTKDMLINPLYFTPTQFTNNSRNNSPSTDTRGQTSPLNVPGSRNSPASSPGSTHSKYSVNSAYSANSSTRNDQSSVPGTNAPEGAFDKPPPLPPKTYRNGTSMSSTRSSIASNTSSSSASSKDQQHHLHQQHQHRPSLKDTDSGLGASMPVSSTCDLDARNVLKCANSQNRSPPQVQSPNGSSCEHRRAICAHDLPVVAPTTLQSHHVISSQAHSCHQHMAQQPPITHHHCTCQMPMSNASTGTVDPSQMVTLRPKKSRGRTHKCDYNCERPAPPSPPPLPPPDSIIFSLDTPVPLTESGLLVKCDTRTPASHCCCQSRVCHDERNKENVHCNLTCSCGQHVQAAPPQPATHCMGGTCRAHAPAQQPAPVCDCQAQFRRQVRTYRREHKSQSVMTKSMRSYSIAETSILKSANSLSVDISSAMTHSSSFPYRLSHCASTSDADPPPLPPKKRNMNAYMLVVGNYSGLSETADFYRLSAANFTKSMIDTKGGCHQQHQHFVCHNSTTSSSVSAMSLSSSASSNSSICTSASCSSTSSSNPVTMVADHLDKQQYLHLPMAPPPPPPSQQQPRERGSSPDKSPTPPPRLPPRRDKLNELPLAPPPPPPVSSSSVIQQRMQQSASNVVSSSGQQALTTPPVVLIESPIAPRSSTPLKHSKFCPFHGSQTTEQCARPDEGQGNFEGFPEEPDDLEDEEMTEEAPEDEAEELPMTIEELEEEEEEEEVDSGEPKCCPYCSEGTVHEEADCVLAQADVPNQLLTPKSKDDDDDLGDLAIRAGTVDGLLMKATQANATGVDATYLHTFLSTYRSFLSPEFLLEKLIFRYTQFSANTERTDIVRSAVAGKVVAFIVLVVNEFYLYDFSKSLSHRLMEFIYHLVGRGDLAHAKCLREKCYEKLRQRDREIAAAANMKLTTYNISTRTATLLDFKSEDIAQQMTLLDSRLFHKIEIPELLIWAKEQKEELIPNLNCFTEHFNKMSFWARSQILACEDQKEREKYVLKYLKIMKNLKKLNNFNSYLSLLAALASAPISRLEWPKNIQETFKEYHLLIDSSSSFRTYRTVLANTKPPCIPYIGLILQDLTFVHIGNADFLPDGKVNFAKHYKQFSILSQMKQFQQCKYSINESEPIISYFDNFDNYLQDEVMWQISESIKPRGGGSSSSSTNAN